MDVERLVAADDVGAAEVVDQCLLDFVLILLVLIAGGHDPQLILCDTWRKPIVERSVIERAHVDVRTFADVRPVRIDRIAQLRGTLTSVCENARVRPPAISR